MIHAPNEDIKDVGDVSLTEDKEDTCDDPGLKGVETVGLGGVGGDGVEDVDENQEECDEQGHATLGERGSWGRHGPCVDRLGQVEDDQCQPWCIPLKSVLI